MTSVRVHLGRRQLFHDIGFIQFVRIDVKDRMAIHTKSIISELRRKEQQGNCAQRSASHSRRSRATATELARMLYLSGRPDESIEASRKALDLEPFFMRAHIQLGEAFLVKGMLPEAIQELKRAVEMSNSDVPKATLASAYAASGDLTSARRYLKELESRTTESPVSPYSFALLYAALGESEAMFAYLEEAYQTRASALIYVLVEPGFKRYHSDVRYQTLIRRMGLKGIVMFSQ